MRIRCVGHACLEIETRGLRVVTNPWWEGPAYGRQWYPWPTPQPAGLATRPIDYVFLSHGRDDHFHSPTLRTLQRDATALVPELVAERLGRRLREQIGFCEVLELRHGRTATLRRRLRATAYVNVTDSILVLEDGDRVLVDANVALRGAPAAVVDHFVRLLRDRHPSIDTLFLGYTAGSWFPNCVRLPGKNDRAVARAHEERFRDAFSRIVADLRPRLACASDGSYALVEPHLRWMNDVRLSTEEPDARFARRHPQNGTRVHLILPNDVIEGVDLVPGATARADRDEMERAYGSVLRAACESARALAPRLPDEVLALVERLDQRVRNNAGRLAGRPPFEIDLRLRDNPGLALRVRFDGRQARAETGPARAPRARLEIKADLLDAAIREERGLESILVGSGAVASIESAEDMAHIRGLFSLLSPRPSGWQRLLAELRASPRRQAAALLSQRWPLALYLGSRLGLLPRVDELRGLASEPHLSRAAA